MARTLGDFRCAHTNLIQGPRQHRMATEEKRRQTGRSSRVGDDAFREATRLYGSPRNGGSTGRNIDRAREEYLFSVAVVVLTISPHFFLVCVCARPVIDVGDHGTLNQGRDLPEMSCVGVEVAVGEMWSERKLRLELDLFACLNVRIRYLEFWGGRDVEGAG